MKILFRIGFLLFFIGGSNFYSIAQIPLKTAIPNCDARNQDFQDRRQGRNYVNFGKAYYEAELSLPENNVFHKKAQDEWTPLGPFGKERLAGTGRVNSMQFHPTDTNIWFICVAQGGIWKTTNAGKSWINVSGDLPILRTSSLVIHPTKPDIMYVALGDYAYLGHNLQANENKRNSHYGLGVYKTTDGGVHWTATGLSFAQTDFEGSLIAKIVMHKSNPDKLLAVGQTGSYATNDAGKTWIKTSSGLFWDVEQNPINHEAIYATTGYVATYKYGAVAILKSTDFGTTWTAASTPLPVTGAVQRVEIALAPSDTSLIYAIACDSINGFFGFYKSDDGGRIYKTQANNTYKYNLLNSTMGNAPGGQGRYDLALCVDKNDKNRVLVGGINMWQSFDGGKTFEGVNLWSLNYYHVGLHADIHEIVQHPNSNSFFVSHDGGLSRTNQPISDDIDKMKNDHECSTQWSHFTDGLNITSFYRLSLGATKDEFIAGAQDNSTVYGINSNFSNLTGGDGMESAIDDAQGYRYTSSQYGNIYAFEYYTGFYYDGQIFVPAGEVAEWTTPMVAANSLLYILYGNVHTALGSNRIQALSNFDKIPDVGYTKPGSAFAVEKTNGQRMYVGKRGYTSDSISNEIWTTDNGGKTWENVDKNLPKFLYPSYLEMNQSRPEQAWLTFSGFDSMNKVFQTNDAGKTWKNITYDLPNIPVNCVVFAEQNGYVYVGTDLGVYALDTNKSTWEFYSNGLPKVIVSELEIHPTFNTLVAATFGAGVWEIGLKDLKIGVGHKNSSRFDLVVEGNPINNELFVRIHKQVDDVPNLKIIDITGKIIIEEQLNIHGQEIIKQIDFSAYYTGLYFVILENNGERIVRRIVKE